MATTQQREERKVAKTNEEILVVPPGSQTKFNSVTGQLVAERFWTKDESEKKQRKKIVGTEKKNKVIPRTGLLKRIGLGIDAGGTYTDAVIYDLEAGVVLDKGKSLTTKWDLTVGIDEVLELELTECLAAEDVLARLREKGLPGLGGKRFKIAEFWYQNTVKFTIRITRTIKW